jgi:hypothetical protein
MCRRGGVKLVDIGILGTMQSLKSAAEPEILGVVRPAVRRIEHQRHFRRLRVAAPQHAGDLEAHRIGLTRCYNWSAWHPFSRIDEVQSPLDPLQACADAVDSVREDGILTKEMSDLPSEQSRPLLELGNIGRHVVLLCPYRAEMFEDKTGDFIGHPAPTGETIVGWRGAAVAGCPPSRQIYGARGR